MKEEAICVVYYKRLTDENMIEANLHDNQKKLALEMLKQGFSDFFSAKFDVKKIHTEEGGKPYYEEEGYFFNISHCRDVVVVALAKCPVGVDVEQMRLVKYGTIRKCCSDAELVYVIGDADGVVNNDGTDTKNTIEMTEDMCWRFLELWTRKESYVKLTGQGLRVPANTIAFDVETWKKVDDRDVVSDLKYIADFVLTVSLRRSDKNTDNNILLIEY